MIKQVVSQSRTSGFRNESYSLNNSILVKDKFHHIKLSKALSKLIALVAAATLISACSVKPGKTTGVGAGAGAAIGAGLGAIVGAGAGDPGTGLALGLAAGSATGAMVGNAVQGQDQEIAKQSEIIRSQESALMSQRAELDRLREQLGDGASSNELALENPNSFEDSKSARINNASNAENLNSQNQDWNGYATSTGDSELASDESGKARLDNSSPQFNETASSKNVFINKNQASKGVNSLGIRQSESLPANKSTDTRQRPDLPASHPLNRNPKEPSDILGPDMKNRFSDGMGFSKINQPVVSASAPKPSDFHSKDKESLKSLSASKFREETKLEPKENSEVNEHFAGIEKDDPNLKAVPRGREVTVKEQEVSEVKIVENSSDESIVDSPDADDLNMQTIEKEAKQAALEPTDEELAEKEPQEGSIMQEDFSSKECQDAEKELQRSRQRTLPADKLFHLRRALRLCPGSANFHLELAELYRSLGRDGDSVFEFHETLRLEPNNSVAKKALRDLEQASK